MFAFVKMMFEGAGAVLSKVILPGMPGIALLMTPVNAVVLPKALIRLIWPNGLANGQVPGASCPRASRAQTVSVNGLFAKPVVIYRSHQ